MKVYTVFFLVKNLTPLLLKNPNLSSPPYLSFRKASENSGESPVKNLRLCTAACFAARGHKVIGLDKNKYIWFY